MLPLSERLPATDMVLVVFVACVGSLLLASVILFLPSDFRRKMHVPSSGFALGCLLSSSMLVLIPDAMRMAGSSNVLTWLLASFLLILAVDLLFLRQKNASVQSPGVILLLGDGFHSFADGAAIASAFCFSQELGMSAAFMIFAHEIALETSDFAVLLRSGFTNRQAFVGNLLAALPALAGALLVYHFFTAAHRWLPLLMSFSASSLLYVGFVDLLPDLRKRRGWQTTLIAAGAIVLGITIVMAVRTG